MAGVIVVDGGVPPPPASPFPPLPPPPSWTRGCRVAANEARDEAGGRRRIEWRCSFGRELSVACVMQWRATEAECVDLLMMMAWFSADMCHWVISCPKRCRPAFTTYACEAVSVPSGQVVAALETGVGRTPG